MESQAAQLQSVSKRFPFKDVDDDDGDDDNDEHDDDAGDGGDISQLERPI